MLDDSSTPTAEVLIVSYNSAEWITPLLAQLARSSRLTVRVLDNASQDDTVSLIRQHHPGVEVVESPENLGFSRAVNRLARGTTAPILILLNPDTSIDHRVLEALADLASRNGSGVVAPVVRHDGAAHQIISAGHFPTVWRMLLHFGGISRLAGSQRWLEGHYLLERHHLESVRTVDWATGACFAIRTDTWEKSGGLTERWFMYAEDIEFCFRIRQMGLPVELHSDLSIEHRVGGSQPSSATTIRSDWVLNLFDFYCSSISKRRWNWLVWGAVVSLGLRSRAAAALVRRSTNGGRSDDELRAQYEQFSVNARDLQSAALKRAFSRNGSAGKLPTETTHLDD